MELENNPENCRIVANIVKSLCPDLEKFGNEVTYESISFPENYANKPTKEVFELKLQEYIDNIPLNKMRIKRNKRLEETDYLLMPDYPHASDDIKIQWMNYRQALRDLPNNITDYDNIVWPEKPNS
jgi:hypothetical protein